MAIDDIPPQFQETQCIVDQLGNLIWDLRPKGTVEIFRPYSWFSGFQNVKARQLDLLMLRRPQVVVSFPNGAIYLSAIPPLVFFGI